MMLAQNFLSARDLGLHVKERDALIKTLVLLETDKLVHVKIPRGAENNSTTGSFDRMRALSFTGHFNMDHWRVADHHCRTVCCIGGTAELIGNIDLVHCAERLNGLYELFYPVVPKRRWSSITIVQAARALRNYLTDGNPDWEGVMRQN